ncbi:hypothetical protein [Streptacidiphilus fuscans]|uniref:Uncharacterized protein n=1 Tax=Streptacidiphilus fuscans TaxID=2789292 RepID=A0A931BCA5_9ACTN|nr:hypothetical protein [Streptacidiphilus fuscans]MBF9072627.1 hypothetical protein [Streptacidiphilus fuscans]
MSIATHDLAGRRRETDPYGNQGGTVHKRKFAPAVIVLLPLALTGLCVTDIIELMPDSTHFWAVLLIALGIVGALAGILASLALMLLVMGLNRWEF